MYEMRLNFAVLFVMAGHDVACSATVELMQGEVKGIA